jgi:hypothetical protein
MAYFANSDAGCLFDAQCMSCIFGERPCPIAFVQTQFNYEALKNPTARAILDELVKNDGTCCMFELSPEAFMTAEARGQMNLFDWKEADHGENG